MLPGSLSNVLTRYWYIHNHGTYVAGGASRRGRSLLITGLTDADQLVVLLAAWFHDLGYLLGARAEHEAGRRGMQQKHLWPSSSCRKV